MVNEVMKFIAEYDSEVGAAIEAEAVCSSSGFPLWRWAADCWAPSL